MPRPDATTDDVPTASRPGRRPLAAAVGPPIPRVGRLLVPALSAGLVLAACGGAGVSADPAAGDRGATTTAQRVVESARSLDGSGNDLDDATVGAAGQVYPRVAEPDYADGVGQPQDGPAERYLSNRIFNDDNQNVFSENGVTHWGFVWGQFLDHTFGLRESSAEPLPIGFDPDDPLEAFTNDLGAMDTTRSAAAPGTGVDQPREQVNTVSSHIDGWAVYGGTEERLDWLRDGVVDGDPTNNAATLLLVDGHLPTAGARPDVEAPATDLMGRLHADPSSAVIAGDLRANENLGLTAVHTLFAREHNRIVGALPDDLTDEEKFQVARRVVGALQQFITYEEFLPAMGVDLDPYDGYDPDVDPSITNEFATVGYRAHSQVHGEFEAELPADQADARRLTSLEAQGIEVASGPEVVELAIPLNVAFGNPRLVRQVGLGNVLAGLGSEAAYANDEQIDNQLRSVLFQVPGPDVADPQDCLDGTGIEACFSVVNDLGALDVARARDHGMPSYNDLRVAYGLAPVGSFAQLTGEPTDEFPDDPAIDADDPINDPDILDVVSLADADGIPLEPGSVAADAETVAVKRRTATAARLRAIFDHVDHVDAFTGMVSEAHVAGTEFGELQLAMWTEQFTALRDGDRYFHADDPVLVAIRQAYGVDHRRTLGEVVAANTDVEESPGDVFVLDDATSADIGPDADADGDVAGDADGDAGGDADGGDTVVADPDRQRRRRGRGSAGGRGGDGERRLPRPGDGRGG